MVKRINMTPETLLLPMQTAKAGKFLNSIALQSLAQPSHTHTQTRYTLRKVQQYSGHVVQ